MNLRYRFTRWLLSRWISPKTLGAEDRQLAGKPIYVFANPSVTDVAMLDLAAQQLDAPQPHDGDQRRYLALNRPAGFWRRLTMRSAPYDLESILNAPNAESSDEWLVPVVVLWGRAPTREWSFWRSTISENWATSGRFKRLLNIVFNSGDISVQIGQPIAVAEAAASDLPENTRARRAARLLRVRLKNQRVAAIGPDFSHRRTLVRHIVQSRAVQSAIERKAKGDAKLRKRLNRKAMKQAQTIASDLSYPTVRVLEALLTWFWNRIYDGVDFNGTEQLAELAQTHTLVYVPSHRSHLDYLLLSYLLYHRGFMIPHIAAGDNLNVPVLGSVLRRGGAFFMRRTFRDDDVYRTVFSEYLYQVYRRGHSVEFFPEGGRSRTGRLLQAKTGLLRMTIAHQQRGLPKPIALIPVYVGYEKLVEAASYLAELRGESKRGESVGDVFRSVRLIRQDFGRVSVNVGEPLMLDGWIKAQSEANSAEAANRLGSELMARVNAAADVNPTNLVALATLEMPRLAIEAQELVEQIACYQALLRSLGWPVTDRAGRDCIEHIERLQLVACEKERYGEIVSLDAPTAVLMTWYRNNVSHTLALPSLIACLMLNRRRALSAEGLQSMIDTVYPYLARELSLRPDQPDLGQTIQALQSLGLLQQADGGYLPPASDSVAFHQLYLLGRVVLQNLERLYIVASLLTQGNRSRSQLLRDGQAVAALMARVYGLNAPEFSDRKLLDQFVDQMLSRGVVVEVEDGNLEATEIVHEVTRLARFIIPRAFQRAVQRVGTRQTEPSAPSAASPAG